MAPPALLKACPDTKLFEPYFLGRARRGKPRLYTKMSGKSFPTPIGLCVAALKSQLLHVCAIRQHGPYLVAARTVGLKNNVPSIRRPAGEIIAPGIVRELYPLFAGDDHQVKIVGTRFSRPVLAHPGEG